MTIINIRGGEGAGAGGGGLGISSGKDFMFFPI